MPNGSTSATSLLSRLVGSFVFVECRDGQTASGVLLDYDDTHLAIESVSRKTGRKYHMLIDRAKVSYIASHDRQGGVTCGQK